jgi:hypothetical protein
LLCLETTELSYRLLKKAKEVDINPKGIEINRSMQQVWRE